MQEKRNNPRFIFHPPPRAEIEGISAGEAVLLDISVTGCRISCTSEIDLNKDTEYVINIIPEKESHIGSFDITANSIWTRKNESSCEIGFFIIKSPEGKRFERYVDYLAWRTSNYPGKSE